MKSLDDAEKSGGFIVADKILVNGRVYTGIKPSYEYRKMGKTRNMLNLIRLTMSLRNGTEINLMKKSKTDM